MAWPRSSNCNPDPATRSFTVEDTRISPGLGLGRNAGSDVDRDPGDLLADDLALAGVQAGADLEPELAYGGSDRLRAADCSDRPVEGGEEPVAGRVDLATAEAAELLADERVVAFDAAPATRIADSASFAVEPTMSVKRTVARTVSGSPMPRVRTKRSSSGRAPAGIDTAWHGSSNRRAPGMRDAMYAASSHLSASAAISVGTRIAPRMSRTSTSAIIRRVVATAPGLAESRQRRASAAMN